MNKLVTGVSLLMACVSHVCLAERIEAENFSEYFDTTPGNTGGDYRQTDVDIRQHGNASGYYVGWIDRTEYLKYPLTLPMSGLYRIAFRVSAIADGKQFHMELDGTPVGESIRVPKGSGWHDFTTVQSQVSLPQGQHTLTLKMDTNEFNIDYFDIEPIQSDALHRVPGTIEAEDYTHFFDTTPGNSGGAYRNDAVDVEPTSDQGGGFNIGWTAAGEWLEYPFVSETGRYRVITRVASRYGNASYKLFIDDQLIANDQVPSTGGWQSFQSHTLGEVHLSQGEHGLKVLVEGGEFNLNWIQLERVTEQTDSDGDGIPDDHDQCPNTQAGQNVDENGCALPAGEMGIQRIDSDSIQFYLQGASWAIVHYRRNQGSQLNVTMDQLSDRHIYALNDLNNGDQITYSYTYWDPALNGAVDTETWVYTHQVDDSSPTDTDGDGVPDNRDHCPGTPPGTSVDENGCPWAVPVDVKPLYDSSTPLEPTITFDRGDALVTRFSDRARDRHAKENHFQAYDHYLSFYWEDRTISIEIEDFVAKGGNSIRMNVKTLNKLDDFQAENRWFYVGKNTLAEFCGNGVMTRINNTTYFKEDSYNCREQRPIQIGDKLEFEISQFLDEATLPRGRSNYYGTTFLYIVGEGIVPWDVTDKEIFQPGKMFQRDSIPIPLHARLGGDTTLHVQMTAEPDGHFQQMATNLGYDNGQPFVLGRRLHHSSFVDGRHDEHAENGVFGEVAHKAGPRFIQERCSSCHVRNGRAKLVEPGQSLDNWVIKVGDASGNPHPQLGRVLQPRTNGQAATEGQAVISSYSEHNGLRKPHFMFSGVTPEKYSARIAPQLYGMGLLEAIPESAILSLEDPQDQNGDGISGRAHRVVDPVTGDTRLGRFGYKATTSSLKHQIAAALNTDMGVMTSILPSPDCGSAQSNCGSSGSELSDQHLTHLMKYIALLGVRPQRDYNNPSVVAGKNVFHDIGCADCHVSSFQTSMHHPLAELRDQTIAPYTDLLLHDMGPGLADNLDEGQASGREWRTAPLWGLGLSPCVTGGVAGQRGWDAFGLDGHEFCTPHEHYLHDGRARTIEEAILWHGGEAEASKQRFESLSTTDQQNLLQFLRSL